MADLATIVAGCNVGISVVTGVCFWFIVHKKRPTDTKPKKRVRKQHGLR